MGRRGPRGAAGRSRALWGSDFLGDIGVRLASHGHSSPASPPAAPLAALLSDTTLLPAFRHTYSTQTRGSTPVWARLALAKEGPTFPEAAAGCASEAPRPRLAVGGGDRGVAWAGTEVRSKPRDAIHT